MNWISCAANTSLLTIGMIAIRYSSSPEVCASGMGIMAIAMGYAFGSLIPSLTNKACVGLSLLIWGTSMWYTGKTGTLGDGGGIIAGAIAFGILCEYCVASLTIKKSPKRLR